MRMNEPQKFTSGLNQYKEEMKKQNKKADFGNGNDQGGYTGRGGRHYGGGDGGNNRGYGGGNDRGYGGGRDSRDDGAD